MRIAYLIPENSCRNGKGDGIRAQARDWAAGLRKLGVDVELVGPWDEYDFSSCDIVHFFNYYLGIEKDVGVFRRKFGVKVVLSPIVDTNRSAIISNMASRLHFPRMHMYSLYGSLRACVQEADAWFVRSEYERDFLCKAFGVSYDSTYKVMLATRLPVSEQKTLRDDFCLQVCYLPARHKNVMGLIDAAIKYNFKLVLAGNKVNAVEYDRMMRKIAGHQNIKVLGFVSDDELIRLYRRARVFALPSFQEGVGLVALEAAANGCDIVLTERGAPKEYYNGMAKLVNPCSIDSVGKAVCDFLRGESYQPMLKQHIAKNYTMDVSVRALYKSYEAILGK